MPTTIQYIGRILLQTHPIESLGASRSIVCTYTLAPIAELSKVTRRSKADERACVSLSPYF